MYKILTALSRYEICNYSPTCVNYWAALYSMMNKNTKTVERFM